MHSNDFLSLLCLRVAVPLRLAPGRYAIAVQGEDVITAKVFETQAVMWRVNWIHPFEDGNGRTSRAVPYLVLCVKTGYRLPGSPTIPERIADSKFAYYDALDAADSAWRDGEVDVSVMEELLDGHLADQLLDVYYATGGRSSLEEE